jgi:hypothetical protein
MAYRDFKTSDLKEKFGLTIKSALLFPKITNVDASSLLLQILERNKGNLRMITEKIVSEAIILPILLEIQVSNRPKISLFSGQILNIDKSKGLNGELDFLFVNQPDALELSTPIICITEAKLDSALEKAVNQAAAQMIAAQIFNEKDKQNIHVIHGAVSNGFQWLFLRLENNILTIDTEQYSVANLPQLLGVLQTIVDFY